MAHGKMEQWPEQLSHLDEQHLRRRLRVRDGVEMLNLASNDYLGLAADPRVIAALQKGAERYGVGAGASRLVTGHAGVHAELEEALAAFKHAEAALVFSSGYAANVGVLSGLAGPRDYLFLDRLNHASLFDGARLARGRVKVYRHKDVEHLEHLLEAAPDGGGRFIITDGVFSMDGDLAPLPELAELAERHEATLIVDDAHGTGVTGPGGKGTAAHFGCEERIPVRIGTLSKALGTQGGFAAGPQPLIDLLVNRARAFIYSTGISPALAAAAREALRIVDEQPERRERQQRHVRTLCDGLSERGFTILGGPPAPMLAVMVGAPDKALKLSAELEANSIRAPAIRPPTVPDGTSRIRLAPQATHSDDDIQRVLGAFARLDDGRRAMDDGHAGGG